jgi:hypothetical protein
MVSSSCLAADVFVIIVSKESFFLQEHCSLALSTVPYKIAASQHYLGPETGYPD